MDNNCAESYCNCSFALKKMYDDNPDLLKMAGKKMEFEFELKRSSHQAHLRGSTGNLATRSDLLPSLCARRQATLCSKRKDSKQRPRSMRLSSPTAKHLEDIPRSSKLLRSTHSLSRVSSTMRPAFSSRGTIKASCRIARRY